MHKLIIQQFQYSFSDMMRGSNSKKLEIENKLLKEELKELQNTELIKSLAKSLERISKGKFITRKELGI